MWCFGDQPKTFPCKLVLLDDSELIQDVQRSARGQELLDVVIKHLNLVETAYFGLRFVDKNNQTHWLDPGSKITKQLQKCSTSSHTFYFGVKFYSSDPCKLVEEVTRYQFFLQVKQDILLGRLPVEPEMVAQLFAYAVQSELGDYDPHRHVPGYVSEFRFVANQTVELEDKIAEIHQNLIGQVPAIAEHHFLDKIKWLDMYGVDLHSVLGEDNIEYYLGLTPSGVIVLRNQAKVGNYYWPRITKVYFKGKYFMLRVRDKTNEENTFGFELPNKQACKHLWRCCVEHHTFFRLTQVHEQTQQRPKLFSMGSKMMNHIQTEKKAQDSILKTPRMQPSFTRKPSKRYQRRDGPPDGADAINLPAPGLRDESKNNLNSVTNERNESSVPKGLSHSRSNTDSTAPPWVNSASQRGLYTSNAPDSPRSVRSAGNKPSTRFPLQRRSSVESEVSCDSRRHRHRHHHRSRKNSDNESEISKSSVNSKSSKSGHRRKHRSKHHRDSESESDYNHRHRHRRHRSDNNVSEIVKTEGQWRDTQRLQYGGYSSQNAVVKDLVTRKSGYINSGMETESEACYRSRKKHRRRSRSRSKSPDSRHRPPEEIRKYIEYRLIDTKDMNKDELQDIKYTKVETDSRNFKIKYSPKGSRHRHKSPKHSRSCNNNEEAAPENRNGGYVEDMPPPPYSPHKSNVDLNNLFVQPSGASTAQVSMATTSKLHKDGISYSPSASTIQMYGNGIDDNIGIPQQPQTSNNNMADRFVTPGQNVDPDSGYASRPTRDHRAHEMSTEL